MWLHKRATFFCSYATAECGRLPDYNPDRHGRRRGRPRTTSHCQTKSFATCRRSGFPARPMATTGKEPFAFGEGVTLFFGVQHWLDKIFFVVTRPQNAVASQLSPTALTGTAAGGDARVPRRIGKAIVLIAR